MQPDWPIKPLTAMTMRAVGLAVVTCSASIPAPGAEDQHVAGEIIEGQQFHSRILVTRAVQCR